MKRLIVCASVVALATTATTARPQANPAPHAVTPAQHASKTAPNGAKQVAHVRCKPAPADEYFGKLKMSILGIRNTIKDQGFKIDADATKAPSTMGAIALTEDAIHDWQHKYPCDSWLPGMLLSLQRFYGKIHTDDGVRHVHATYAWLHRDFPRNWLVATARREDGAATATPPGPATAVITGPSPATTAVNSATDPAASPSPIAPHR